MPSIFSRAVSKGRQVRRRMGAAIARISPTRPVFVIGCGRSGTTILGKALARHPRVTYLNEPRHLWRAGYPPTDIWSPDAEAHGGRLVLGRDDGDTNTSRKLRHLFGYELSRTGRPQLIEKLPINSFRLPFLLEVFPDARIVFLHRQPREVARSIARAAENGPWFGHRDYKWQQLSALASHHPATAELPALCVDAYSRGLLEWRLSNETAESTLAELPPARVARVSYQRLVEDPKIILDELLEQLQLEPSSAVTTFASREIKRKSGLSHHPASDLERRIIGPRSEHWEEPQRYPAR